MTHGRGNADAAGLAPPPTLLQYTLVVVRIGLTSFGGGVSAWMMRVMVQQRRWIAEADFVNGLSLSQVFPGVNVLNMAIWMGYRLHGGRGAVAGALAMIAPPGLVIIALATVFDRLAHYGGVRTAMAGVAAAAIGLGASMGVRTAQRVSRTPALTAVLGATFVAVGLAHLPLVPVVLVLAPVSVGLAWGGVRAE